MKKFFFAAMLIAVVSGAVFAQELKFDGYLNSGLGIIATDEKDADPLIKAFGNDSEQNGYRFRLNGSYTNEDGNAGARFRFQSQARLDQAGYFSLPYAYGWVKFLNNIFTLNGGIVDDGTWATGDWWIGDDVGEGLGMLLRATPISGLDLGFHAYVISQQSGGSNNILNFSGGPPNFANSVPKLKDAKYVFSGAYLMPETFRASVTFRMKNKAGWDGTHPSDPAYDDQYDGRDESSKLVGDLRLLAVQNLTAVVSFSLDKLEDFSDTGDIIISETFGYRIDSLSFGLNAVQFLYNRVDADGDKVNFNPSMLFNLWTSYAFGNIVPRLDLAYFMGGRSTVGGSGANTWHRRGFQNRPVAKDDEQDVSVFSVTPSARFNIDSRTFIEIGNKVNYDFGYEGAYKDKGNEDKKSRLSNAFYVDLRWTF
ncbi:MAG: hypothetical protein FWG99_11200 [Treponema sp.]|nr:hypothetical protein [Treponema sp.]